MRTTRMLTVKLTDEEFNTIVAKHSDAKSAIDKIDSRKKAALADFRHEKKPIADEAARLDAIKASRCEEREVECEELEDAETGNVIVRRLDTGEVVEEIKGDGPPKQPGLPFAAPPVPVIRCTVVDVDGLMWPVSIEQAERVQLELDAAPAGTAVRAEIVDPKGAGVGVVLAVRIMRGRACETCGIVAPHHRPECAEMKADDANDTGDVAARIDAVEGPNDASLVPEGEASRPLVPVKPKRGKKANGAASAEVGE